MSSLAPIALFLLGISLMVFAGEEKAKKEPDWYESDQENFISAGMVSRDQILSLKVFNYHYIEYVPESDPVQDIHNCPYPIEIKVFLGDCCKDSKKHVSAFIKTMEFADNKNIRITYINVTPDKKQPADLLDGWNISSVPTFVVLSNGKELGRIVETPKTRIELDLASLLSTVPPQ